MSHITQATISAMAKFLAEAGPETGNRIFFLKNEGLGAKGNQNSVKTARNLREIGATDQTLSNLRAILDDDELSFLLFKELTVETRAFLKDPDINIWAVGMAAHILDGAACSLISLEEPEIEAIATKRHLSIVP